MCATDRHDTTLALKVALNPNTTNQPIVFFSKICKLECNTTPDWLNRMV